MLDLEYVEIDGLLYPNIEPGMEDIESALSKYGILRLWYLSDAVIQGAFKKYHKRARIKTYGTVHILRHPYVKATTKISIYLIKSTFTK